MYFYFNSDSNEYDLCIIKIEESNVIVKMYNIEDIDSQIEFSFSITTFRTKYLNKQFVSLISDSDFKEYDDLVHYLLQGQKEQY
jgi:hypothetical protein